MADEQGEVVRFVLRDNPLRELLFTLFHIKIHQLSLPPAPALPLEPAQDQDGDDDDDRVPSLFDEEEANDLVSGTQSPVELKGHDALGSEPNSASSEASKEDLSTDEMIIKLKQDIVDLEGELGKVENNPFQQDRMEKLERRIRKKREMLEKLLLEKEDAKDESQTVPPLNVSDDLQRLEKLKAKHAKLRKSLKKLSPTFQQDQYQTILNKIAKIKKEIDGLEALLNVAKKQKIEPVVNKPVRDVLDLFEQMENSYAPYRFSNEPYSDIAGTRIEYNRQILLGKVLKRAEEAGDLMNQIPLQLHIVPGVAARRIFDTALDSNVPALGQAFLLDAAKAIESDIPHTNGIISAPLAAVLMAKQFATIKSRQRPFINSDGTAFLAEFLLTSTTVEEMERSFSVTLITRAAVFGESIERGKFLMPKTPRYADFTFAPRIDLGNLSTNTWLSHKTDLLKYASMIYEATYLAAIERKAKRVVLGSAFVNGTPEQYKAMIVALVRVHVQLSRLLERDVEIIIAVPELTSDDFKGDLDAELSEANAILSKQGARISYSISHDEVQTISPVAFEGIPDPMPDMTNVMLLDIHVEGEDQGEIEAKLASPLSLHRYYQSEIECKYLYAAASSTQYFTIIDPSQPSEPIITNSLIINSLHIRGVE